MSLVAFGKSQDLECVGLSEKVNLSIQNTRHITLFDQPSCRIQMCKLPFSSHLLNYKAFYDKWVLVASKLGALNFPLLSLYDVATLACLRSWPNAQGLEKKHRFKK